MAAPTYIPFAALHGEIAFGKETVYTDYATPTIQIPHAGGSIGRFHVPIVGEAATSTAQGVIGAEAIRGLDFPALQFACLYGPDTRAILNALITGSTLSGSTWAINDWPESYSVNVNFQRSGGNQARNLLGTFMESCALGVQVGGPMAAQMRLPATRLKDPATATAIPTLAPTIALGPFILKSCLLKHSETTTMGGAGTQVKFRGVALNIQRGILTEHTSEGTEPTALVPTGFKSQGMLSHNLSPDLWTEFGTILAAEADGGFTTRYIELLFVQGGVTQRLTIPARIDCEQFDFQSLAGPVGSPIRFFCGGDDSAGTGGVPTNPTIKFANA